MREFSPDRSQPDLTWPIPAAAFGPKAQFVLSVDAAEPRQTRLAIKGIVFGGSSADHIDILLRPHDAPSSESGNAKTPKKTFVDYWSISLQTDLWRGANGNAQWRSEEIRFRDFSQGKETLKAPANASFATRRMVEIFDGRLRAFDNTAEALTLAFTVHTLWQLSRKKSPAVTCFDGRVTAGCFTFGWYGKASAKSRYVHGRATAVQVPPVFRLGAANGSRVEISNYKAPTTDIAWEVSRLPSPIAPSKPQTLAKLSFGGTELKILNGPTKTATSIRASSLFLAETMLPTSKVVRQTLWGTAGPGDDDQGPDGEIKEPSYELQTLIGHLFVDAPPVVETTPEPETAGSAAKTTQGQSTSKAQTAKSGDERANNSDIVAAIGDRNGARSSSIWAVFDRSSDTAPVIARRIAVDLTLRSNDLALPDTSYSALSFASADLRLIYEDGMPFSELKAGEYPRPRASSFVWVGPVADATTSPLAQFDLSRAVLTVARDVDLMKLRFRFLDMNLVLCPKPVIRPAHADCRVIESNGVLRDDRPVLVVEFDPQHVFEEAAFAQIVPPPDAPIAPNNLNFEEYQRDKILRKIAEYDACTPEGQRDLTNYRLKVQLFKRNEAWKPDGALKDAGTSFGTFSDAFKAAAARAGLPEWQQIYIGPFALDPDGMALARQVVQKQGAAAVRRSIDAMFERVNTFITENQGKTPAVLAPIQSSKSGQANGGLYLQNALNNESIFEQQEPLYGLFRDFYRGKMIENAASTPTAATSSSFGQRQAEYLATGNRPPSLPEKESDDRVAQDDAVRKAFVKKIAEAEPVDGLMEARLSGRTRLAFHVNCQPPAGSTPEEARLVSSSGASPQKPTDGGFGYPHMAFSFEALTDWSRHEPAVTRRARKLFTANANGILPPIGDRAPNLSDSDILAFQGLTRGPVTAEQRLAEVRASLASKPTPLETAIELPARLTLSTAQDAVWLTDRILDGPALPPADDSDAIVVGESVLKPGTIERSRKPLWTARLSIDGAQPDVRIVDSPDLRLQALTLVPYAQRNPGQGAPPRGPLAPWFIGAEQMDAKTLTAKDVNDSLPVEKRRTDEPETFCKPPVKDGIWRILRALCTREDARNGLGDWRFFRAALDAYDRHELVLLSSAYGLPVIGKRKVDPGSAPTEARPGSLVENSGEVEPGDDFPIIEADSGQAIQRPQSLNVTELWLSALGGSLLHDTRFFPSAGASDIWGRQIFDGFSIERWRAEIVLGRDIVGEVVYKGYLFPFGHRASLVKLTERLFLLTKEHGVKAVLVQRIFLRIGRKSQAYPAVGQPFSGRLWCSRDVTMRTVQTPDLRDPYEQPKRPQEESPQGRIYLGGAPGLAFWPRVNELPEGLVKFEFTLDGAFTSGPLIFVDNIAATNAAALGTLCDLYRNYPNWSDRRTLSMGLQSVRYAPEQKSGDCSLKTDTIVLDVHGLSRVPDPGWLGRPDDFHTTPILEGAEQPPFYPAMKFATVRLEHVERFSGGKPAAVEVQYDGHYVRNGFSDRLAKSPPNPMEIFLDLRNYVSMTMGPNGDRSGAIGRPETNIVAIGRRNGPMSASGNISYELSSAGDTQPAVHSVPTDGQTRILSTDLPKLVSLADYFDPAKDKERKPIDLPAAGGAPPAMVTGSPGVKPADPAAINTLKILQSFFSGNAKVLGVVTIRQLLEFLGLGDFFASTPVLRQTLLFGSGVPEEGQSLIDDLHTRVLAPLKTTVEKLNTQWTGVSDRLNKELGGKPGLRLSDVFPEISSGLLDLSQKIGIAQAENDPVQLAADLAEVYESGRFFVAALNRIAANPLARLKQAAVTQVQQGLQQLSQAVDLFIQPLANQLVGALDAATIIAWLNDQLSDSNVLDDLRKSLTLLPAAPDLISLLQQSGQSTSKSLEDIDQTFQKGVAIQADVFIKTFLTAAFKGKTEVDAASAIFIQGIRDQVATAVAAAKQSISDASAAAKAEAIYIVNAELDAYVNSLTVGLLNANPPALQNVLRAMALISEMTDVVQGLKTAITNRNANDALLQLDRLAGFIFGTGPGPFKELDGALSKGFTKLQAGAETALNALPAAGTASFAQEALACSKYESDPSVPLVPYLPASGEPMATLAKAIKVLDGAAGSVAKLGQVLGDSANRQELVVLVGDDYLKEIDKLYDATSDFLIGKAPDRGLRGDVSLLYCESVKTIARMRAALVFFSGASWDKVDDRFADRFAQYIRAVTTSADALGKQLVSIVNRVAVFVDKHKAIAAGAAFLGAAAEVASKIAKLSDGVKAQFDVLKSELNSAEADTTAALAQAVNFSINLVTNVATFGQVLSKAFSDNLGAMQSTLNRFGVDLDPEFQRMAVAVQKLNDVLASLKSYKPIDKDKTPTTILILLSTQIASDGSGDVKGLFSDAQGKFLALARQLAATQNAAVVQWRALQVRAFGLPWKIEATLFVNAKALLMAVAQAYGQLKSKRDDIATQVDNPLLSEQARRALFAPPVYAPPPRLDINDPSKTVDDLKKGDRLKEEVDVLNVAKDATLPTSPPTQPLPALNNLMRFVASWGGGSADRSAPLQIIDRVNSIAMEVLRGEVLSLIDVTAFRDAIEDAIVQLIPTKAIFSYDFASKVTQEPDKSAIFQAHLGTEFKLSTRLTVDLLKQASNFQVNGSLGAFDIQLVGDFIKALTLRFGGASFQATGDSKPRFDVSYIGYEIGEALQFAKELEPFLSPSNGSGVHIGPLSRTVGVEAGYGINLGSIGVGEVSFFNVILDVSAELPFDHSEALFKTSLGTRLTPFTMSVVPFAGSGYFAIYSAADGIRGFEASFLFGGGGSLQFGPLAAQVQVQVGTFIRVLRVNGVNSTEIYGTFLAAGAASIWIFHFAATLYVSLGQDGNGNMYGEATFTFSFSCGLVDYNYSVTATHNQPAVGKNGTQTAFLDYGTPRTQFAALTDSQVASDVPTLTIPQANCAPSDGTKAATPIPDVTSKAICQAEDWKTFASYFDTTLLPAEH